MMKGWGSIFSIYRDNPLIAVVGGYTVDENIFKGRVIKSIGGPPYHMCRALEYVECGLAIATVVGKDMDLARLEGLKWSYLYLDLYGGSTIRFRNIYDGERVQEVHGGGYHISTVNVLDFLDRVSPDYVILSPVYNEVPLSLLIKLSGAFPLIVDIQGFVRYVDIYGRVYNSAPPTEIY